jgi:hypothetical protein
MIYVTGFGQMCNNMLQLGHVYAFGKENNLKVIGLRFCYKYTTFKVSHQKGYNWFTYLYAKYAAKLGLISKIDFDSAETVEIKKLTLLNSKNSFINGWFFREYDLFQKYQDEIKNLFQFDLETMKKGDNILNNIKNYKLGVHVRRGDYNKWLNGKYFYDDIDYVSLIKSFKNNFKLEFDVVIVTNDIKIDKDLYLKNLNNANLYFAEGNQEEDLYILSKCDYIIGPPSTFSLMASFYNHTPLYWVYDKSVSINIQSFNFFEHHFKNII